MNRKKSTFAVENDYCGFKICSMGRAGSWRFPVKYKIKLSAEKNKGRGKMDGFIMGG